MADELETWGEGVSTFAVGVKGESAGKLMDYWAHGEGAAKIRWGTDGSFSRCVRKLARYFPKNTKGLCANLHKKATGEWPAEEGVPS